MCITAYLWYERCDCTLVRYYLCHSHIKHTFKQIDTEPCPYAAHRHIILDTRGCTDCFEDESQARYASVFGSPMHKESGAPIGCPDIHSDEYNFGTRISPGADLRFLELGEGGYMSGDCRSGKFMMSEEHTCGLGIGVSCLWAHDINEDMSQVHSSDAMKSLQQLAQEDEAERYKQNEIAKFRRFRKYVDEEKRKKSLSAGEKLTIDTIERNFEKKVGKKTAWSEKRKADHHEEGRRFSGKLVKFADVNEDEEAIFAAEYVSQNGAAEEDDIFVKLEDMEM